MTEFKNRGWNVSRYHLAEDLRDMMKPFFDIVITMDWKGIDIPKGIKSFLNYNKTFLVRENGDTPQNYFKHLPCCENYDLLLTPDYVSSEKYNAAGYNCLWMNHFADTGIHNVYLGHDEYPPVRSTRGRGGSTFMDNLSYCMPHKFINMNGLMGTRYGAFLNNGKIVLQNSRWGEITRRIFEGMACDRMVLTDRLSSDTRIDDLFEEGKDIVYYDNIADCISKINYYLCKEGKEERETIATNGYRKVLANHTQVQRVDTIIENYKEWRESFQ
jgi:hypothetical protein